jgi:hypothetical protein
MLLHNTIENKLSHYLFPQEKSLQFKLTKHHNKMVNLYLVLDDNNKGKNVTLQVTDDSRKLYY